jgi:hypothetical protein
MGDQISTARLLEIYPFRHRNSGLWKFTGFQRFGMENGEVVLANEGSRHPDFLAVKIGRPSLQSVDPETADERPRFPALGETFGLDGLSKLSFPGLVAPKMILPTLLFGIRFSGRRTAGSEQQESQHGKTRSAGHFLVLELHADGAVV